MKLTMEGEIDEIVEMLKKINIKNETDKGKVAMSYSLSNSPLEFMFDEYKSRV